MGEQATMLAKLRQEFTWWAQFMGGLSEEQATARRLDHDTMSVKDIAAHLLSWQELSIARMEAAQHNTEPVFPWWTSGLDPESEQHLTQINANIYHAYGEQPWTSVREKWQAGFRRFITLAEAAGEADLLDTTKYPWLHGHCLLDVLAGAFEHHYEHRTPSLVGG